MAFSKFPHLQLSVSRENPSYDVDTLTLLIPDLALPLNLDLPSKLTSRNQAKCISPIHTSVSAGPETTLIRCLYNPI